MLTRLGSAVQEAALSQPRPIPTGFLLGAAAASYQIEGAVDQDGRGPSIWDTFSRIPGNIVNGDTGDVACDHYHRYRDDVALMRDLNLETYRFSVSWPRVCPDGSTLNPKGLDFYSRLVDELLNADILPWLTLYHWDLPQALEDRGGWPARDTAYRFRDYAMKVYDGLGDRVKVWTTLNEPWCSSFLSYTAGEHAPGHHSLTEGLLASHHLLLGHGLATQELQRANQDIQVGLTINCTVAQPLDPDSPEDQRAARLVDGQANRWFLDPLYKGFYPKDIVEEFALVDAEAVDTFQKAILPGDMEVVSTPFDTMGINYYQSDLVTASFKVTPELAAKLGVDHLEEPPNGGPALDRRVDSPSPASRGFVHPDVKLPRTAQNWVVDPLMLKELLLRIDQDYSKEAGVALYVTENGAAYDDKLVEEDGHLAVHDSERTSYLKLHLGAVLDAVDGGADVRGYMYWSLMDNYEWAWGYDKRFGIVYVDYATQQRIPKDSALAYASIIASRTIDLGPDAGVLVRRDSLVEGRTESLRQGEGSRRPQ